MASVPSTLQLLPFVVRFSENGLGQIAIFQVSLLFLAGIAFAAAETSIWQVRL